MDNPEVKEPGIEPSPVGINYLYFGFFFLLLLLISESNIFIKENLGDLDFFSFFMRLDRSLWKRFCSSSSVGSPAAFLEANVFISS